MSTTNHTDTGKLTAFAEHAAAILLQDERVRILWLTGSLATGTADAQSDVDLRAAVQAEDFTTIGAWWPVFTGRPCYSHLEASLRRTASGGPQR
jgi:hypothetical protein